MRDSNWHAGSTYAMSLSSGKQVTTMRVLKPSTPLELFHYTTTSGFLGIVDRERILPSKGSRCPSLSLIHTHTHTHTYTCARPAPPTPTHTHKHVTCTHTHTRTHTSHARTSYNGFGVHLTTQPNNLPVEQSVYNGAPRYMFFAVFAVAVAVTVSVAIV